MPCVKSSKWAKDRGSWHSPRGCLAMAWHLQRSTKRPDLKRLPVILDSCMVLPQRRDEPDRVGSKERTH